jgi:hypothetical protein
MNIGHAGTLVSLHYGRVALHNKVYHVQLSTQFSIFGGGYWVRHFLPQTCVVTTPAKKATAKIIA